MYFDETKNAISVFRFSNIDPPVNLGCRSMPYPRYLETLARILYSNPNFASFSMAVYTGEALRFGGDYDHVRMLYHLL